jgi:excisionase family DNA binding protein
MTAQEAAEALSLSKQSIIRRVDNQRLDGYRDPVTGHYRVSRAAVERLRSERESLRRAALLAD